MLIASGASNNKNKGTPATQQISTYTLCKRGTYATANR